MDTDKNALLTVSKDKHVPGLLSFPAFELVYMAADSSTRQEFQLLSESLSNVPLPRAAVAKAATVAATKDLNSFRYKYLGMDDDDIRDTFNCQSGIRAGVVADLHGCTSLKQVEEKVAFYQAQFENERTARTDLMADIALLYASVLRFEMLEQHLAGHQLANTLPESCPWFMTMFDRVMASPEILNPVLQKMEHGMAVDPL